MLINELPDECLLHIFNYINDLDNLINCYKVSKKWSCLVAERTRKVKYLLDYPVYLFEYAYYEGDKPIDGTVMSTLFGNLIIAHISFYLGERVQLQSIADLLENQNSLKGLISSLRQPIADYCETLEMFSWRFIDEGLTRYGSDLKQLNLWNETLNDFKRVADHFPNLERLHIYNSEDISDTYYDGPVMEKLKIVELSLSSYDGTDTYYGFQFMDKCPNLRSAHIKIESNSLFVDESLKHESLQDLVIYFFYIKQIDWDEYRRLFMKYPNLKHLALRDNTLLKDEHIEQFVRVLPNLVLFDVRGSPGVTQRAADYVHDYCNRYGKSIKFYFNENQLEIASDWPQLCDKKEEISRGFDFMKHCFLKKFRELSVFMIPIDY